MSGIKETNRGNWRVDPVENYFDACSLYNLAVVLQFWIPPSLQSRTLSYGSQSVLRVCQKVGIVHPDPWPVSDMHCKIICDTDVQSCTFCSASASLLWHRKSCPQDLNFMGQLPRPWLTRVPGTTWINKLCVSRTICHIAPCTPADREGVVAYTSVVRTLDKHSSHLVHTVVLSYAYCTICQGYFLPLALNVLFCFRLCVNPVSYTHLTLPTNRLV